MTTAATIERVAVGLLVLSVHDGKSWSTPETGTGPRGVAHGLQVTPSFALVAWFADRADSVAMRRTWPRPHDAARVVRQLDLDVDEPVTRGEG